MTSLSRPISHVTATNAYVFPQAELARLASYRAAVQAGFYTDAASAATTVDDWPAAAELATAASLFTRAELTRLVAYRCAIGAGLYSDFPLEELVPIA
jgi:hypothetical protein